MTESFSVASANFKIAKLVCPVCLVVPHFRGPPWESIFFIRAIRGGGQLERIVKKRAPTGRTKPTTDRPFAFSLSFSRVEAAAAVVVTFSWVRTQSYSFDATDCTDFSSLDKNPLRAISVIIFSARQEWCTSVSAAELNPLNFQDNHYIIKIFSTVSIENIARDRQSDSDDLKSLRM